jgi:arsenate reductase
MKVVIYHNPSCATSRKVLGFIREAGVEPTIIPYVKEPPTKAELLDLLARMKLAPRDLLRKRGTPYDELGLADASLSDAALVEAMLKHPILIERPIVVTDRGVALCRPPETVHDLLAGASPEPPPTKGEVETGASTPPRKKPTAARAKAQPILLFRVSLDPKHYREIEILGSKSLYHFAEAIIGAFGFDFDHAFGFYSDLSDYVYHSEIKYELFVDIGDADPESKSVKKTKIAEAFAAPDAKMTFLFDYGDEWLFEVARIGAGKTEPGKTYPLVVKSVGKAPKQYG